MKKLFYFSVLSVFVLLSCEKFEKKLSVYELFYLVENDSLISIDKSSLTSVASPDGSKLIIKNKQDTIFVKTNVLKKKFSVLKNGERIERLNLYFDLVNSQDSTLASARFVNICRSNTFDITKGDRTFNFRGNISLLPDVFSKAVSSVHEQLNNEIQSIVQNSEATVIDVSTGKNISKE